MSQKNIILQAQLNCLGNSGIKIITTYRQTYKPKKPFIILPSTLLLFS